MPEFIFTGTAKLNGVMFFVQAKDEADAKKKAKAGDYSYFDANAAETSDWSLDPTTCKLNE